eukprot:CAMPEP_0181181442 /NCGR_PEP_ID=MMETSP1096-20121128/7341_1 /TAXON_ID=156174 ORGANISM="Chrysochromulina ericina, Strain CCMP281" /NCGR_SAMPLE_ID=MMETSP1096 /ASSEMBLY_ACC=CAM_ASM_000453 /LENGTH=43 /DNA_ID= /DNA_START= /DNA_END= /DNA_ORIENTATION=
MSAVTAQHRRARSAACADTATPMATPYGAGAWTAWTRHAISPL